MITYNIPPKPGEVILDRDMMIGMMYLSGHTDHREALVAGAGFAIGSLLLQSCENTGDVTKIVDDVARQAIEAFTTHNKTHNPNRLNATRLAAIFHYGMEQGSNPALDATA